MEELTSIIEEVADALPDDGVAQMVKLRLDLEIKYGGKWGVLIAEEGEEVAKSIHWSFPGVLDGTHQAFCLHIYNGWQYNAFMASHEADPSGLKGLDEIIKMKPGEVLSHCCRLSSSHRPAPPTSTHEDQPLREQGTEPKIWEDPWRHAFGEIRQNTYTQVQESREEWSYVERLFPRETVPVPPKYDKYPTPSGWTPPSSPPPDLPYYVRRTKFHTFPLYLEERRDDLDVKTMEFNYVELVLLGQITGDIFACEQDLCEYLESKVGHPIASHVMEHKGIIRIKGADRSLLEQFLTDRGF